MIRGVAIMCMSGRLSGLFIALAAVCLIGSAARAMTFERIGTGGACATRTCVLANGDIDGRSAHDFEDFVREARVPKGALVVLNSAGGNVVQSLALGKEIRVHGLSNAVASYEAASGELRDGGVCASACAYAFLGGVERTAGAAARIGVHQMSARVDSNEWLSAGDSEWLVSLVAVYIRDMGGDLGLLIPALRTAPCDMHWLSQAELSRYALTTRITLQNG
jgi:hypothetical protein